MESTKKVAGSIPALVIVLGSEILSAAVRNFRYEVSRDEMSRGAKCRGAKCLRDEVSRAEMSRDKMDRTAQTYPPPYVPIRL